MVKILFSTISMFAVLGVFAVESAARNKKPKATPVSCGATINKPGNYFVTSTTSPNCDVPGGITINASNVTLNLKGHIFVGSGLTGAGISASNVSNVKIIGPGFLTLYEKGVNFNNVRNSIIEDVTVLTNIYGIFLHLSRRNEIQENEADGNFSAGIFLQDADDNEVKENNVFGNGVGIELISSNGNEIEENQANNNSSGGISLSDNSSGNEIEENEANGNIAVGISIDDGSTDNEVEENTAFGNDLGTDLLDGNLDCDDNEWEDNDFGDANQPCIN
jgi:parallel beta-helix repeat protein